MELAVTCAQEPPTIVPGQPNDVDASAHRRFRSQLFETLHHFLSAQVSVWFLFT
ncbi:hypothetical protein [Arthrobacter sp. Cr_A7]|uniref:hypothetical protein n=1 Tax=Arthrobacter sp. Cr_A7 TaxID=3031017 RepID=UPI0023DCE88D|nr:hypothetical protein [Arthrobacter sp. Cr_A7]MDF2051182.1 hypothetical protein [Arthrobacter sp. Cr_A7]